MQYLTLKENIDYKQVVRRLVDDVSLLLAHVILHQQERSL